MPYERLLQKGHIGGLTVKNRAVMSPMSTEYANHDGTASERLIRYYEERAKGGVGLIINEYTGVDDVDSVPSNHNLRLAQDYHIAAAEQLTEAVHRHGCLIFAQLHHGGNTSKAALSGRQALSASDVSLAPGLPVPRPMTKEEILCAEQKFINAAIRAQKAGYDGVELHAAHSYLLAQFFSPYYNKRSDEYGGSFENRMRLIDEIIDGIHATLPGYPLTVRISGDEMTPNVPGTLSLEDGLAIGRHLEAKGILALNVSNGSGLNANANCDPYSYPSGWKKYVAKAFKEALSIPIIATNTIKGPDFAEALLAEGVCDFVGLGRSQFSDAFFMQKACEGRADEIRKCIGCMWCRERLMGGFTMGCAINPRMGREYCLEPVRKNGAGRKAIVVGGGPSGMQAAITLAERGFTVSLWEKEAQLGGTLNLAAKPPCKDKLARLVDTLKQQLELSGTQIRLSTAASPETVAVEKPDLVFLCCGAQPIVPRNLEGAQVCTAESVLRGEKAPAGNVVVIGTGLTGLETAEVLGGRGCKLTLVEMQPEIGPGIFNVIKNDLSGRLQAFSPLLLPGHRLDSMQDGRVLLTKLADGEKSALEADWVVLALGVRPEPGLLDAYEAACGAVVPAGDAKAGGRIRDAIYEAYIRALYFD